MLIQGSVGLFVYISVVVAWLALQLMRFHLIHSMPCAMFMSKTFYLTIPYLAAESRLKTYPSLGMNKRVYGLWYGDSCVASRWRLTAFVKWSLRLCFVAFVSFPLLTIVPDER